MWPANHHRDTGCAKGIGNAVCARDHPRHGANTDQSDFLIANVLRDLTLVHRLSVAINEQHFMSGRGQSFKQKHP